MIHLFGNRLRELRKNKNISQEELGEFCGVAKNTISNWENNVNKPDIDLIAKLAKYFNVTTDYLLGLNQDDLDKIERLKIACQEAGLMTGQYFTLEEFEKAMLVVETLKYNKKNG